MTVNKLERFAQIAAFNHVFEHTDYQQNERPKPKGSWAEIFGNDHPITLELACGRGDYAVALAREHAKQNYIGVDIKGARLWKGARQAQNEELANVRFLRIFINHIDEYFAENEVRDIWITFPDPYPRAGDRKKRLTAPHFLAIYQKILAPGGFVYFKTDDDSLFDYSCRSVEDFGGVVAQRIKAIHQESTEDERLAIKTTYEKKHLKSGKSINYTKFRFPAEE